MSFFLAKVRSFWCSFHPKDVFKGMFGKGNNNGNGNSYNPDVPAYEQLGGREGVRMIVERFFDLAMHDERVGEFFRGIRTKHVERQKEKFLTIVFGGPNEYEGMCLGRAHAKLIERGLGDSHFDAVVEIIYIVLTEYKVNEKLKMRVITDVAKLRNQVLGTYGKLEAENSVEGQYIVVKDGETVNHYTKSMKKEDRSMSMRTMSQDDLELEDYQPDHSASMQSVAKSRSPRSHCLESDSFILHSKSPSHGTEDSFSSYLTILTDDAIKSTKADKSPRRSSKTIVNFTSPVVLLCENLLKSMRDPSSKSLLHGNLEAEEFFHDLCESTKARVT